MADLTKIRNLRENQLNEIAIGEIVLNVDALTYVTKNSAGKIVPYDIDYKLPDGDATHLYLKWDETTQQYTARTVAEFISDLAISDVPEGSATALYLKWNNSTDPKRWEALTLAQFKTALAYTTIDAGSATLLYPKWNNSLTKYEGQLPSTVATDIGAVSTLNWGNPDGGYKFDGVDDYVTVPDNANLDFGTGDFSVEHTFKQISLGVYARLSAKYASGQGGHSVYVNSGKIGVELFDGTSVVTIESSSAVVSNDTPYHLIVTITGRSAYAMYLNGALITSAIVGGTLGTLGSLDGTGALRFGISNTGSQPFNGLILNTRLFNRALSQAEVTKLYNNGRPDLASLDYADLGASQTSLVTGDDSTFASDTSFWTLNTNVTIADGVVKFASPSIYEGFYKAGLVQPFKKYKVTYTIVTGSYTSGGVYVNCGGIGGTIRSTEGTFTEEITSASDTTLSIKASSADAVLHIDNITVTPIGCVAEYLPKHAGHYSWIETQNGLHGTATGGVIPLSNKIGDIRTAYLLSTSESPTMTDVIKAGWKVESITMTSAENLTEIDATQETSSVALLTDKTNNNTTTTWSVADHNIYPTADKDIVFKITGNGGAGTHIYVNLKKIV